MDDEVEAPLDTLDLSDESEEDDDMEARSSSGKSIRGSIAGSNVT